MEGYRKIRAIVSGGGTGGHIFPALAIAQELSALNPESEILFVGAEGRMEMEKVPAAGYKIVGLPVAGLQRSLSLSNLALPYKMVKSVRMARHILNTFKPDIAIGVGGYASAPLLWAAEKAGVPTLIQEQNGFAGLANRILGKKVGRVCVAYSGMERFFPAEKIVFTGNPIRQGIVPATPEKKAEALGYYGLDKTRRTILILGGSLGSKTLNDSVKVWISAGCPGGENAQILWQCGKYYKSGTDEFMAGAGELPHIHHTDFIGRVDLAYAAADVVVSRSGASCVSELCATHKAVVFVPSPNVTEDHQRHNAMALVKEDAALIVSDADAREKLMPTALGLLSDEKKIARLEKNIASFARASAVRSIADEIYKLVDNGL